MLQRRNPANDAIVVNIDGRIFRLERHLARLRRSGEMLRYEGYPDDAVLVRELGRTLAANRMHDGVHVRLTVSRVLTYTSGLDQHIHSCNQLTSVVHSQSFISRVS